MSCSSIVTNGCNGSCCAAVFFPISVEELGRIRDAKLNGEPWVDDKGNERKDYPTDKVASYDYIIEMLIPLGWQITDPETGKSFLAKLKERESWDDGDINKSQLESGLRLRDDGEIEGYIVTCKHFDTENRICKDYDNRPGLCRMYGTTCKYEGCKCASIMEENKLV